MMNELQVVSYEQKIMQMLSTIFNRSSVEQMMSVEYLNDEMLDLIERVQEIYSNQVREGDFSVDSLIDCLQTKDEEVLHEIAEMILSRGEEINSHERTKEAYDDMIEELVNDLIIDYEVEIFTVYPAFSKENIPSLITWSLDSAKDAYYVIDPPPGSFRAYCKEIATEVYYNDAQNVLIEELGVTDKHDDSLVLFVRRLAEKVVELKGT